MYQQQLGQTLHYVHLWLCITHCIASIQYLMTVLSGDFCLGCYGMISHICNGCWSCERMHENTNGNIFQQLKCCSMPVQISFWYTHTYTHILVILADLKQLISSCIMLPYTLTTVVLHQEYYILEEYRTLIILLLPRPKQYGENMFNIMDVCGTRETRLSCHRYYTATYMYILCKQSLILINR